VTYLVNDIWYTLQGEGYWTGRPAAFVRFSRCNLWTGREEDRATAICTFCDTDFTAAERMTTCNVLDRIDDLAPNPMMVVFTGGEPSLQLDAKLVDFLHERGHYVAIETNGTRRLPVGLDWVCVSPKAGTELAVKTGDELKVVYPQDLNFGWLLGCTNFTHYWLSPMDGPNLQENTKLAVEYVLEHPQWRLNIQSHK
jgi:7-carboxy-7-deazaguanine synthase